MPALPSSRIDPAIGHLAELAAGDGAGEPAALLAVLAGSLIRGPGGVCVTGSR